MQLVAYGAQDVYLTGSPQITFFKVVYRRHTNFSVEPIPQTFNGASDFGRTVTCTINRNGDLITNMYANIILASQSNISSDFGYVRRLGHAIVQHYKIEIGGSKIDEQYGDWLNIWYELTHKIGQERGYNKMIGDVPQLTDINSVNKPTYQLYVPLQFWFNRNNGLALPLIALQYHDVRITIDFRQASQCVNKIYGAADPQIRMNDAQLIIDYVYLDSEERKRFAQASHEYLIEQLQFTGPESLSGINMKYRLNFNHPSKYLIWASHLSKYASQNTYLAYSAGGEWEKAREKFAKAVWFATRNTVARGPTQSDGTMTFTVVDSSGNHEVVSATPDSSASAVWVSKVTAQQIFAGDNLVGGNGISAALSAAEILDSIIIVNNNVSINDLSMTTDSVAAAIYANPSDAVISFLHDVSLAITDQFNYGNFIDRTDNTVLSSKLQLNGSDRFQERDGHYFNYVQPYQHFSNTPADGINVYSFALKPEDHQPSGSCNFSRIDNTTLNVSFGVNNTSVPSYLNDFIGGNSNSSSLNIYTVNYNVFRVMSGMGGIAYSN